ncbi:acyl-CoA dehydrogenase family protein [Mycobacterium sp. 236(2023)]|uniref:acyl-CoA dehydrogenase family protein n=1 Tax=Mycobacterium sp. 236(2023) TaxID=3038163 RepID=UPI0024151A04|nr:acyl-CoA dehydrogenase family protein [Mycobacterium sp. 236(2023)]MDG4668075.1 acyl-CoA/acyl-ACP dehydrogenase [Mycobacterium sp. 236(2023)]
MRCTISTDEHDELRSTARRFFEKNSPEEVVRATMESSPAFDRALWQAMSDQLGLPAILVPEEFGGAGFGFGFAALVMEELGRALVCAPFLSTAVIAVEALVASEDAVNGGEMLSAIAEGSLLVAVAFTDKHGHLEATQDDADGVRARHLGDGWALTGVRQFVIDAAVADVLLVLAETDGGWSLFRVPASGTGVTIETLDTLDLTRGQAHVHFDDAPAQLVGEAGRGHDYAKRALTAGLVGIAAEQVGGARRAMEMSVDYAKVREQFGRPIGSFQAIKHKCADMLMGVESGTSAVHAAALAIEEGSAESALLASLAKAYCSDAYCQVAAENIQVHGGIGFTWEHPAHLYFRRAKSTRVLFGDPVYHRERILQELGL